jgi:hypothetical protein
MIQLFPLVVSESDHGPPAPSEKISEGMPGFVGTAILVHLPPFRCSSHGSPASLRASAQTFRRPVV